MERQNVEGLAHQSEDAQPQEIFLYIPCVEQAHGETVAEDGESQPSDPAEDPHPRKEGPADVVDQHGDDGDELEKVRVQIGFQPVSRRRDNGRGGERMTDAGTQRSFSGIRCICQVVHCGFLLVFLYPA